MKFRRFLPMLALAWALPAQADWYRADSEHFVIYADDSETDVARFADMLERYDAAMSFVTQSKRGSPSPSNRVTIFAVSGATSVKKLMDGNGRVAGFYVPRAGGSVAFVDSVRPGTGELDFSMTVLLHEYAHHFLIGGTRFATPRWMSEGAAEFFASAKFPQKGEVHIGRPARHRVGELTFARKVPIEELFDRGEAQRGVKERDDSFYGRSWALYHYLIFSEERKGQLVAYAREVAKGSSSIDAAQRTFGSLSQLDKEIDRYLQKNRMLGYVLQPDLLPIKPVTVTKVSAGLSEMMPVVIRSKRGVDETTAQEVLAEARSVAARWSNDADVLAALAEAEYDGGNDDAAIAAANAALAIDANATNAYVQKGYALFRKAGEADDKKAAYAAAMKPFTALNRLENNHPLPLIYYYRSFRERGLPPPEVARHGLEKAADFAPFDQWLSVETGLMLAGEGKIGFARSYLSPVAASPHGGGMASHAKSLLDAMADAPEGTAWTPPLTARIAVDAPDVDGPEPGGE